MQYLINFLCFLTRLGVRPTQLPHEQERIIKLNKVYLLSIPCCTFVSFWSLDSPIFAFITLGIAVLLQFTILLHHWGRYNAANIYSQIVFNLTCTVLAIGFKGTTGSENYMFVALFTAQMQYHFRKGVSRNVLFAMIIFLFIFVKIANYFPHPCFPPMRHAPIIYIQNTVTVFLLILFLMYEYEALIRNYQLKIESQKEVLQEKTVELQRSNDTRDKLFSIIGHDLMKPIASLRGILILLSEKLLTPTEEEKYLEHLVQLADATDFTLKNLLDWGREAPSKEKIEAANVYECVNQNFSLFAAIAAQKNIALLNELPKDITVKIHRHQLDFVLRNLVNNAIKFTHYGGEISVYATDNEVNWTIAVKDNGLGIKPENLSRIFNLRERFSTLGTAKEAGSGLGLPLCHQFIKDMGGQLHVQSQPQKGSTFSIILPKGENTSPPNLLAQLTPQKQ